MRIFFGIQETGFYHGLVVKGLRELGYRVSFVRLHARNTPCERDGGGWWQNAVNLFCHALFHARHRSFLHKLVWKSIVVILQFAIFPWVLLRYTHFVFNFGRSILPGNIDLPVLRLFGRKVLFVFHGSDSRPAFFDGGRLYQKDGTLHSTEALRKALLQLRRRLDWIGRWANWIVDNPFSAHFQSRKIINWYSVGLPVCEHVSANPASSGSPFRIVHAPSVGLFKGTPAILTALNQITTSGENVEIRLIKGRTHEEVLEELKHCDLVVDQIYSDTPCAGLVMEAAQYGKPSIVGGPGWCAEWLSFSGLKEYPSAVCGEDRVHEAATLLLENADIRRQTSEAACRLAEEWHYSRVAGRIAKILHGEVPEDWYRDINDLPVAFSSGGIPSVVGADAVRRLVDAYGADALCLNDKPQLLAKVLAFAEAAAGENQTETVPGVAPAAA